MRPCDQCRQPVENHQRICGECEQYNREHGLEPPPPISARPHDPNQLAPVPLDASVNLLTLGMGVTALILAGLIGLALGSLKVAIIGGGVAVLVAVFFAWSMR